MAPWSSLNVGIFTGCKLGWDVPERGFIDCTTPKGLSGYCNYNEGGLFVAANGCTGGKKKRLWLVSYRFMGGGGHQKFCFNYS